jgi:hypothetical protein
VIPDKFSVGMSITVDPHRADLLTGFDHIRGSTGDQRDGRA